LSGETNRKSEFAQHYQEVCSPTLDKSNFYLYDRFVLEIENERHSMENDLYSAFEALGGGGGGWYCCICFQGDHFEGDGSQFSELRQHFFSFLP
jgi:hypothetical protein